uniref:Uncharacterized protein n=1 Tax=Oryza barthii TaxID=65489 RepID=A0A0D3HBV0_9ORYZ
MAAVAVKRKLIVDKSPTHRLLHSPLSPITLSFFVHITAFCVDGFFGAAGDAVLGAIPINAVGDDAATGDGEGDGVGDDDDDAGDGEAYGDGDDEGGDGAGDGHDDYGDDGDGGAAGYAGNGYHHMHQRLQSQRSPT